MNATHTHTYIYVGVVRQYIQSTSDVAKFVFNICCTVIYADGCDVDDEDGDVDDDYRGDSDNDVLKEIYTIA